MPDLPSSSPTKTNLPFPTPAHAVESGRDNTAGPATRPRNGALLSVVLGVAVVILGLVALDYRSAISDRDTTIAQDKNRADQHGAATVLMQAQLDAVTAHATKLQTDAADAKAESARLTALVELTKAGAAETQTQLDQSRNLANGFQTQMEAAKVDSIRHQGEVETAQARTTVMQEQMNAARTDTARLQTQLDASRNRSDALQEGLTKDEAEIAQLKKAVTKS